MKSATSKYTDEAKKLMSGKIREFDYTADVLKVLRKKRINLSASWIRLVVIQERSHDDIWDAIAEVLAARKTKQAESASLTEKIKELVA